MPVRLLTLESKITDRAEALRWAEAQAGASEHQEGDCPAFWLDIVEPDPEAINWLAATFHFHPLTIEDLRSPNERGKIETYEGYLFLIGHAVYIEGLNGPTDRAPQAPGHDPGRLPPANIRLPHRPETAPKADKDILLQARVCECASHELHAYLSQRFLITVHDQDMAPVDKVWDYAGEPGRDGDLHPLQHGPDFLLYHILDNLTDTFFAALEVTADQIDYLEDIVIDRPDREVLASVFTLKQNLRTMRRLSVPMREALNILSNSGGPYVRPENQIYLRDVHNLLVAVAESADTQRDSSSGVLDAYLSSVNNNLSVVMKRLTVIATIFMPLSFIVGFGGMNFTSFIPYNSPVLFWGLIGSLLLVPVLMFIWFQRNRWT